MKPTSVLQDGLFLLQTACLAKAENKFWSSELSNGKYFEKYLSTYSDLQIVRLNILDACLCNARFSCVHFFICSISLTPCCLLTIQWRKQQNENLLRGSLHWKKRRTKLLDQVNLLYIWKEQRQCPCTCNPFIKWKNGIHSWSYDYQNLFSLNFYGIILIWYQLGENLGSKRKMRRLGKGSYYQGLSYMLGQGCVRHLDSLSE